MPSAISRAFFFSSRRRHTRCSRDWSSDVCSSDLRGVGLSERRQLFGETDASVNKKILAALGASLIPIVCVGETLQERESGQMQSVLRRQFGDGFAALTAEQFSRILIAYEPVWAIGTGRTATPELAAEAHRFLRS